MEHDVQRTASTTTLKEIWHKINNLYDSYAKSVGLNFTTILVLQLLFDSDEVYTQKELCEKLDLPKQLINSIMKTFWEQGYIELKEAKDRRNKKILVTDRGRQYALEVLKPLEDAETMVWDSFSVEEISILASILSKYVKSFESALKG